MLTAFLIGHWWFLHVLVQLATITHLLIYIYEDYEHLKEQYFYHKSGLLQKKITHNEFKDNYVTYYSYNEKGFLIDIDYNGRNFTSLLTGAYVSDRSAYSVLYKYPHQESNICQEKITFINDTVKITQTKYLYDTNGNLVRKTIESFRKDNFSNIEEFYYTYSPTNLIIEIKKYYDRIESPTVTYNYEYFD